MNKALPQLFLKFGLTAREVDVVQLLIQGLSNKEIAAHCFISEQTVKDHLKHIYGKMGIRQRAALLAFLWTLESNASAAMNLGPFNKPIH